MPKRPTSNDVARRAGVSRTTVSFVLNGVGDARISPETRDRVLAAARELDYHPNAAARSLVGQQTRTVGLVLCQSPDRLSADAVLPALMAGVTAVVAEAGLRVLLQAADLSKDPDGYISLVREGRVDSMILSGPRSDDEQLARLRAEGFPVVTIGRPPVRDLPFVDVDNVAAAKRAVEHLLKLGHRRVGCITSGPLAYTASADRLTGYRRALEAHEVRYEEELVAYGDDWSRGFDAMRSLLELSKPPTAVFVASDVVALGALQAARSAGLGVPDDLAVVGFDDIPLAEHVAPPLTTVHLPARELGAAAARMLLEILRTGRRPPSLILDTTLVVRDSCGAATRRRRSHGRRE